MTATRPIVLAAFLACLLCQSARARSPLSLEELENTAQGGLGAQEEAPKDSVKPLIRVRRQYDYAAPQQQQPPQIPSSTIPQQQPTLNMPQQQQQMQQPQQQISPAEVAQYNQDIRQTESRLGLMLRQLMNSPYMPTRDQMIQVLSTMATLALMMYLGPAAGPVATVVRQLIPVMVSTAVSFAYDRSSSPQKAIDAPITNVPLAPVPVQRSAFAQTI